MKKPFVLFLVLVMALGMAGAAFAAEYPNKGITVICPWGAGGGTDACLRALSNAVSKYLNNVTLTVENKTGGGGIIGHQAIAAAGNDKGYTFGMITFELSTYRSLGTDLSYEDYTPICRVNTDAAALSVNAAWAKENNITDLASFVEYCKANPNTVNIGGSAPASVWHIGAGLLASAADIQLKLVTFQEGAAMAVTNAAGGHIQGVSVSIAEARSQLEAGNLVCLGVMSTQRSKIFPDVPTFAEQGYNIEYGTWRGMGIAKDVDPEVVAILREAFAKAVEDPDFVTFMDNAGQTISYLNAEDFEAFMKQNLADVSETMVQLGLNN